MFLIPLNVDIKDVMKGLGQSESKGLPPANPVYIELAKSITKGLSQPEIKQVAPDTRYYPAPYRTCFGLGGSGGD
jgi:hypothetical protein